MTAWFLALLLAHGSDAGTTAAALSRGADELNPLLSRRPVINVVEQTALTGVQLYTLSRLSKRKPRLAKVLTFAALGVETYAVSRNIRTLRVQGAR